MSDFTTERSFLLPSFDPIEEEGDRIRRFMLFLESSGVGSILAATSKTKAQTGGGQASTTIAFPPPSSTVSPPPNLEGQMFKKPSAKRLSKKGRKVHANTYQK